MRYQIVVENSAEDLTASVQALIDDGWRPQGGCSVMRYAHEIYQKGYTEAVRVWAQAVTKEIGS